MNIQDSLEGYYIKVDDTGLTDKTTFINKSKGIEIEDCGDEILSFSDFNSLQEEVSLMLDIAVAKGWNLLDLQIDGDDEFITEAKKQILQKIEEQNQDQKLEKVEIKLVRPVSQLDNYILENESKIFESEKANDLKFLRENLKAQIVLDFAKQKYNINLDEFEIVDGNKINNKTNRQKPKSVIDFFTKEIGISIKEATEICNDLMNKQARVIDGVEDSKKLEEFVNQYEEIDYNLKNKRRKNVNN